VGSAELGGQGQQDKREGDLLANCGRGDGKSEELESKGGGQRKKERPLNQKPLNLQKGKSVKKGLHPP